jgi:hypothetical protein
MLPSYEEKLVIRKIPGTDAADTLASVPGFSF